MPMQVILLEKVDNLGALGDVVAVKPGYARNFLIPQNKALRATKDNVAYFEARKKEIEKQNDAKKTEAQKHADSLKDVTVTLLRLASEDGHLYGSVSSRDIADAINSAGKQAITRNMVDMTQTYKKIGLFPAIIVLHPEVKVEVTLNIARSEEEAKTQLKTGKALVSDDGQPAPAATLPAVDEDALKENLLEEEALEAEKAEAEEQARLEAEEAEKAAEKAESRAAKKADKAEAEAPEEDETGEADKESA